MNCLSIHNATVCESIEGCVWTPNNGCQLTSDYVGSVIFIITPFLVLAIILCYGLWTFYRRGCCCNFCERMGYVELEMRKNER